MPSACKNFLQLQLGNAFTVLKTGSCIYVYKVQKWHFINCYFTAYALHDLVRQEFIDLDTPQFCRFMIGFRKQTSYALVKIT